MVRQTGSDARASRSAAPGSAANHSGFPEVGGRFFRRFACPGHRQDAVRGGVGKQIQRDLLRLTRATKLRIEDRGSRKIYIGLQLSVRGFVVPPLGGKAREPDDSG